MDKLIIACIMGIILLSAVLAIDMTAEPVIIKDVYLTAVSQAPGQYLLNILLENPLKGDFVKADITNIKGESVYNLHHAPPSDNIKYLVTLNPGIYDIRVSCANSQLEKTFKIN